MTTDMNDTFAASLRGALVDRVNGSPAARRARRRRRAAAGAVVVALIGGGTALAAGTGTFGGQPGGQQQTPLGAPLTVTGTGTRTIQVGQPPAAANFLRVQITCYTAGTIVIRDNSSSTVSTTCDTRDIKRGGQDTQEGFESPVDDHPNGVSMTVSTSAKDRWKLTAVYVNSHSTPWGINARGQTYGVPNDHGIPELLARTATNGKSGYVYTDQLKALLPTSAAQAERQSSLPPKVITVYRSDGITVIGHLTTGPSTPFIFAPQGSPTDRLRYLVLGLVIIAVAMIIGSILLIHRRHRAVSTT